MYNQVAPFKIGCWISYFACLNSQIIPLRQIVKMAYDGSKDEEAS